MSLVKLKVENTKRVKNMLKRFLRRINIADIIIIALFLIVTASVIMGIYSRQKEGKSGSFEINMLSGSCSERISREIKNDGVVLDYDSKKAIGGIEGWETKRLTGGNYEVMMIVLAKGKREEHGIKVGNRYFYIGQYANIVVGDAVLPVIVEDIKEVQR